MGRESTHHTHACVRAATSTRASYRKAQKYMFRQSLKALAGAAIVTAVAATRHRLGGAVPGPLPHDHLPGEHRSAERARGGRSEPVRRSGRAAAAPAISCAAMCSYRNFNNARTSRGPGSSIVEVSPAGMHGCSPSLPHRPRPRRLGSPPRWRCSPAAYVDRWQPASTTGALARDGRGAEHPQRPGHVVETLSGGDINGPWDMAAVTSAGKSRCL